MTITIKKQLLLLCSLFVFGLSQTHAQDVPVIKYPALANKIQSEQGLVIYNFWATWCRPCVAELPHFNAVAKAYKNEAKVVLVSLDFAQSVDKRVKPFLARRKFDMEYLLLDEPDGETWMGKIDEQWDGAIPATLVVNNKRKVYEFHAGEMSQEDLQAIIEKYK